MAPSAKKYKLFSAAAVKETGEEPLCAFFATEAGCRNGDKCKFKHALPEVPSPGGTSSVVSSESEGEDVNKGLFADPGEIPSKKEPEERKSDKKKKNKKKRKSIDGSNDGDIFAKPKKKATATANNTNKKQKSPQEKSPNTVTTPPSSEEPQNAPPSNIKNRSKNSITPRDKPKTQNQDTAPNFRNLNLPVTSFSLPSGKAEKKQTPKGDSAPEEDSSNTSVSETPRFPLPKSTPVGLKWQKAVLETRAHDRYDGSFSFEKSQEIDEAAGRGNASEWVKARPYGDWCKENPQAIAIDCEMCETKDPVSGVTNPKALCRISVINAEKPEEVLLDTLVKPAWPVVDYRSWVNGIKEEHLENVQFTLRHAQAFLMALCSEETVIIGHALHNDLVSLKMEHHCNVDSACLFPVKDSPESAPSLKDLAMSVLKKEMPSKHDSVNDARTALLCLEAYVERDGKVDPVVRTPRSNRNYASQLFVHRIPKVCQPSHLSSMFLSHTSVQPLEVNDIEFTGDSGKTLVTFPSSRHANLAFDILEGEGQPDKSGRMQKKVFLRNGDYVRVRKMAFPSNRGSTPKK